MTSSSIKITHYKHFNWVNKTISKFKKQILIRLRFLDMYLLEYYKYLSEKNVVIRSTLISIQATGFRFVTMINVESYVSSFSRKSFLQVSFHLLSEKDAALPLLL